MILDEFSPSEERMRWSTFGLLNQGRVAQLFGLSVNTLQKWRMLGTGPAYCKLGKAVYYREADLVEWIEKSVQVKEPVELVEARPSGGS